MDALAYDMDHLTDQSRQGFLEKVRITVGGIKV